MSKNDKLYNTTISFLLGTILIVFGIIIIVFKRNFYVHTINLLLILSFFNGFKEIVNLVLGKKKNIDYLFVCFSMLFSITLLLLPRIPQTFFPRIFSAYLFMCCIFNFLTFLILFRNKVNKGFIHLFKSIFFLGISIVLFFYPLKYINLLLIFIGIYFIILGSSFIISGVYTLVPTKYKNIYKRKVRISLPVIIEVLVPYTVFSEINKALKVDIKKRDLLNSKFDNNNPDMEVMVHVSNNGFNRIGHVDLIYNNKVISYGNYDNSSMHLFDTIGDGVLFYADKKKYIPFCIKHSKKTLFCYGLRFTDKQKEIINKKIADLEKGLVEWRPLKNGRTKYAAALHRATGAKMYKFNKGKFKTYFVFGVSCCNLANEIIGYSGIDFLKMNGIICPGTYYDCLNREYVNKNGIVISRHIYNKQTYKKLLEEE